ncbi:CoA transferase [Nonomuraea ferruginea]
MGPALRPPGGEATYYLAVNRNKRSIALDLRDEADLEVARALAARADVVVDNFKPGTMERLGLGHETLRALNPGLVSCSVTGFGSGEGAALPGYDLIAQAVGGLMSVTGEPGGEGTKAGVAVVDVITGLHAALGILAALRHRDRTGEGQHVEVSLLSSVLSALANHSSAYAAAGVVPRAMGNRHPSVVPYEVFQAADRPIVIAAGNDRQFVALCEVLERPDLAGDAGYATNAGRVAARDRLVDELNKALAARTADEWFELLTAAGVPCGPINDLAAAFALARRTRPGAQGGDRRRGTGRQPHPPRRHPARLPPAAPGARTGRGLGSWDIGGMSADEARRRPPTAQQFVLGELRRAITTGRLRPGAPIRQDALAEELQVSRVPLREALKTLQGEGLVRYEAHRGYSVETLSLGDLREVYRIRELLEEEAVRRAVARLADADLDRLRAAQDDVERAADAGDVLAMATANRLFHMTLFDCAGMPRLSRLIRTLWDTTDAYRSMYYGGPANRERVVKEHRATLDALRRRDADEAVATLTVHRAHAVAELESLLS